MKIRTAFFFGTIFLMTGVFFSGCAKEREESCLTIGKDGSVTQRIIEDFDEENYDLKELEEATEEEIDDFYAQAENGGSVELTRLKESDGKLTMVIDYDSVGSYDYFNEASLFFGTVGEALKQKDKDYFSEEELVRAKDGSAVKTAEVTRDESLHVVIFEENVLYEVEKKILYHSKNVEIVSGKCARLKDSEKGPGYLIYK